MTRSPEKRHRVVELSTHEGADFRRIFEHSNDAIFVIDPERDRILNANPMACRMLGYSREEFLRTTVSTIHPQEMPVLIEFAQSVFEHGCGWTDELNCRRKTGETIAAEISASTMDSGDGLCIIALVRDIAERKRMEAELRGAQRELERRVQERTVELARANELMKREIEERKRLEGALYKIERRNRHILNASSALERMVAERTSELVQANEQMRKEIAERKAAEQALEDLKARLEAENVYLQEELKAEFNASEIVGGSRVISRLLHRVGLVAPTDTSILITGDSGTGKELIARTIHERSARRDRSLIRVNCGAIPRDLFESEFFGHVRGAFTGALKDRAGRFELADGATLFLDEVCEIPIELQSKLLRVLQEGQFERVGDERTLSVDVRVIAATNRDLEREVEAKRFREDLLFRINVFPIHLPPLRERREDIPPLAVHFLRLASNKLKRANLRLTQANVDHLLAYDWPGNARELQNVIERAVTTCRNGTLHFDCPQNGGEKALDSGNRSGEVNATSERIVTESTRAQRDRDNIIAALTLAGGKVSGPGGAAERLGLKPTTLASRIKALGIEKPPRRKGRTSA